MVRLFEAEVEGCYFLKTPCRVGGEEISANNGGGSEEEFEGENGYGGGCLRSVQLR